MTTYKLYVESGPKMKTTMVHVTDLLGCLANGPTTEAALEATPDEIRRYLRFLKKHGENVDPKASFNTEVAVHVTEGTWIGYGDPEPGFAPDFEPLSRRQLTPLLKRAAWLEKEYAAIVRKLTPKQLAAKPNRARPITEIIRHVAEAERSYVIAAFGKDSFANAAASREAIREIEEGPDNLPQKLDHLWSLLIEQYDSASDAELNARRGAGKKVHTPRRYLRRMLEHPWEHLREIERRLEREPAAAGSARK